MRARILLIIGGGIAAYKCLEVIRRLKDHDIDVRAVLTKAGTEFVTPLSVGALTNDRVFTDLFDLDDEREIGHIRLSREADLIVVAPATADLIAKMAHGHASDLATAVLLASDKPVLVAPAMNPQMWQHAATQRNVKTLRQDGIEIIGPDVGEMAERNEAGPGRLVEPAELVAKIRSLIKTRPQSSRRSQIRSSKLLHGRHVLITSGPTHEPLDPVRYISNRSSGRQGYALAEAARDLGADVTLISGPVALSPPADVTHIDVATAQDMYDAVHNNLPADIAIFAAAVADWRAARAPRSKIKKKGNAPPSLKLVENKDILKSVGNLKKNRPQLVIGFAAETSDVLANAAKKLKSKKADWIIANDVSEEAGVMGGSHNEVHVLSADGHDNWPRMTKEKVALRLLERAARQLKNTESAV